MPTKKPKKPVKRSVFTALLADVKGRIQSSQTRAMLAVNASTGTSAATSTAGSEKKDGAQA